MEFSINPEVAVKCHSKLRIAFVQNRSCKEQSKYHVRLLSTLQRTIEGTEKLFGNIFNDDDDVLGIYLLLRFLLPQTVVLKMFEAEKQVDLYVGASYDTAKVVTLPVPEVILEKIKKMIGN